MCTAITYKTKDFYFGRNLDYHICFGEDIVITPRNYVINFSYMGECRTHYAIIGMAHIENDYPLYYDAVNEKGLGIAGLNFVGNAFYRDVADGVDNVAQYEFILWILSQCSSVREARALIGKVNITNVKFNDKLEVASLHWIIADKNEAITVESVMEGVIIYDNSVGVLTNNPTFKEQMFSLNNYMHLSNKEPKNMFSNKIDLKVYSRGMGALGLPGDVSSQSRFVRAVFNKMNSVCGESEEESVEQFFHILDSVSQIRGCCEVSEGQYEITIYSSCCNCDKGIYYYITYDNRGIRAVDMNTIELDEDRLIRYTLANKEKNI